MEKIRIVMGGYLNKDEKLMSRKELNQAISEVQDENERLKFMITCKRMINIESLQDRPKDCDGYCTRCEDAR